jgi:hypothetical protein
LSIIDWDKAPEEYLMQFDRQERAFVTRLTITHNEFTGLVEVIDPKTGHVVCTYTDHELSHMEYDLAEKLADAVKNRHLSARDVLWAAQAGEI